MDIEKTVASIMKRANQLAPNSNFKIDGSESVKFRNIVQALVEELTQAAPEVASVPDAGDEPVAYLYDCGNAHLEHLVKDRWPELLKCGYTEKKLYTRPRPAPAVQVPPLKRVYQVRHLQSPADWKTIPDAEKQRYLDDPEWDVQIADVPDMLAATGKGGA